MPNATPTLLGLTAQILTAHLRRTQVPQSALPKLISRIHTALSHAASKPAAPEPPEAVPAPKRTVFPDYIICLEDGRKLKTLKRHLRGTYGLSPEQYREKWGLPPDYPMVAPSYAERRSNLAKQIGLGKRSPPTPKATTPPPPAETQENTAIPEHNPPAAPELTAAAVFARFPKQEAEMEEPPEPAAATTASARKRQPFAKQRARTMQR